MKRNRWRLVAGAAIVAIVAAACGTSGGSGGPTEGGGTTKVTIAIPADSAAASFIQLAVEAGLTKKYGLDVTLNASIAPPNTPPALISGSIQAAALTSTATQANAKGSPVVNVVNTGTHAPLVMLGAPGLKSVDDLKGKSVVTSTPTDTPGTETQQILKNAGLTDSVKVISVPTVPGRSALFKSGQADAVYEALNLALKDEAGRQGSAIIGDNTSLPITPADGLAVTKSYLASNRAVVAGLVKACIESANMMKNQPQQAAPYLAKIYGLTPEQVDQFLQLQKASLVTTGVPPEQAYANQAELFNAQPNNNVQWTSGTVQSSWDTSVATTAAKELGLG